MKTLNPTTESLIGEAVVPYRPTTPKLGVKAYVTKSDGIAFDQSQNPPEWTDGNVVILHPDELAELLPKLPGLIAGARWSAAQPPDEDSPEPTSIT